MANLQIEFVKFDTHIRLKRFDEEKALRDKRDLLLADLRSGLERIFKDKQQPTPKFDPVPQGSYQMDTGIKPLDGDFDIDVGVNMHLAPVHDQNHSHEVKRWVYEALQHGNRQVVWRKPCITVFYKNDGFHVDIPVYATSQDGTGQWYLAIGKEHCQVSDRQWQRADPKGLIDAIEQRFSGEDAHQFRRVIRALKRWRQVCFLSEGNAAPLGIGLTLAAYNWFAPKKTVTDVVKGTIVYDDCQAMHALVQQMLNNFGSRLSVFLPVQSYNDVFSKMTDVQQSQFKAKLQGLSDALGSILSQTSKKKASEILREQFGSDFPLAEDVAVAQTSAGIVSSSNGA
jgi:hypothetical protein